MKLLDVVKELEGKALDKDRREAICGMLDDLNIPYERQKYSYKTVLKNTYGESTLHGENIYVPSDKKIEIGIGNHFDRVPVSPGANDNSSAIAVTLELLKRFKDNPTIKIGIRGLFFDQEEIGLIGSSAYLKEFGRDKLMGLYNMEMVGQGNMLAMWQMNEKHSSPMIDAIEQSAKESSITTHRIPDFPTNGADHQSFLKAGFNKDEAFTIIAVSAGDMKVYGQYKAALADYNLSWTRNIPGVNKLGQLWHMGGLRDIIGDAPLFAHYHKATDQSEHLNENTLQMVTDTLYKAILKLDQIKLLENNT